MCSGAAHGCKYRYRLISEMKSLDNISEKIISDVPTSEDHKLSHLSIHTHSCESETTRVDEEVNIRDTDRF